MKKKAIKNCNKSLEEYIKKFKSVLRERCLYEIKAKWKNNKSLRNWFCGGFANFGTEENPDFKQAILNENIANFKLVLCGRCIDVIKEIWKENEVLHTWLSGSINIEIEEEPGVKECIDIFKSVLNSRCINIIKRIWNKNEQIRFWCLGQKINLGTSNIPQYEQASLEEYIAMFKLTLISECSEVIREIWYKNDLIRRWSTGESINLGAKEKPQYKQATLEECITIFKLVLSSRCADIIKEMWDENKPLQTWFINPFSSLTAEKEIIDKFLQLKSKVNVFKLVLYSQHIDVIKEIWSKNEVLRAWYIGGVINFGSKRRPQSEQSTLRESIVNFKPALFSRCIDVIKEIWNSNELLRDWFAGKTVNLGTIENLRYGKISAEECVVIFKPALNSKISYIIKKMWESNKSLHTQFNINLETQKNLQEKQAKMRACIANFKSILYSRCSDIIEEVWGENELLRYWFSGKEINLGTQESPIYQQSTLKESIDNFRVALLSRCTDVAKDIWDKNELLKIWFTNKNINLGTKKNSIYKQATLEDCVDGFKSIVSGGYPSISKEIWQKNEALRNWFKGRTINLKTKGNVGYKQVIFEDCVDAFKSILSGQYTTDIVYEIWNENTLLRDWFNGRPINLGSKDKPGYQQARLEECIILFKSVLSNRYSNIIKEIWNKNEVLRIWFYAQKNSIYKRATLHEIIANFKAVLSSRCANIINDIWDRNELLRAWFTGETVNIGSKKDPIYKQATLDEIITNFRISLSGRSTVVINEMWDKNELLRALVNGENINLGTKKEPIYKQATLEECVDDFKSVLNSRCTDIIRYLWKNNKLLHNWFSNRNIPMEENIAIFKLVAYTQYIEIIKEYWDRDKLLRSWYCGKRVNIGTKKNPIYKQATLGECINNFKSILYSRCNDIIKEVWDKNELLRTQLIGKSINLNTKERHNLEDCIKVFKEVLFSRCIYVTQEMWNKNELLRTWFTGKIFNLATEEESICKLSRLKECTLIFKSALSNRCVDVIKGIWDKNELLRAWFTGEIVNMGTKKDPIYKQATLEECIAMFKLIIIGRKVSIIRYLWKNNKLLHDWFSNCSIPIEKSITIFKLLLRSQCAEIIKEWWMGSKLLGTWCGGKTINLGTKKMPLYKQATLEECIAIFRLILLNRSNYIIKEIWESNELLRDWFNLKIKTGNSYKKVTLENHIDFFKTILSSQNAYIIKEIWNSNELIRVWFSGKVINVGTKKNPIYKQAILEDCIVIFKSILLSRCTNVIKEMWDKNELIHSWFNNEAINLKIENKQNALKKSITNFKLILYSRCIDIIKEVWERDKLLRRWCCGKALRIETNKDSIYKQVILGEYISIFKLALYTQCTAIIKEMWQQNELLHDWVIGKALNFGSRKNPIYKQATLEECIAIFKSTLLSRNVFIIREIWNKNELIRTWLAGKNINKGTKKKPRYDRSVLEEYINYFKTVLYSKYTYIINEVWKGNELLRTWLSGQTVNLEKTGESELTQITLEECVNNFKLVLATKRADFIQIVWKIYPDWIKSYLTGMSTNRPYNNKVLKSPQKSLEDIIKRVISISTNACTSVFTVLFISLIQDQKALNNVLRSISGNSLYIKNKRKILKARISELSDKKT